jgi:hypothetical protein
MSVPALLTQGKNISVNTPSIFMFEPPAQRIAAVKLINSHVLFHMSMLAAKPSRPGFKYYLKIVPIL